MLSLIIEKYLVLQCCITADSKRHDLANLIARQHFLDKYNNIPRNLNKETKKVRDKNFLLRKLRFLGSGSRKSEKVLPRPMLHRWDILRIPLRLYTAELPLRNHSGAQTAIEPQITCLLIRLSPDNPRLSPTAAISVSANSPNDFFFVWF